MKKIMILSVLMVGLVGCGNRDNYNDKFQALDDKIGVLEDTQARIGNDVANIYKELEIPVIGVIKPCENSAEVFFKLETGEVVSYFEDGDSRYLSYLEVDTLYQSTDNAACKFHFDIDGNVVLD